MKRTPLYNFIAPAVFAAAVLFMVSFHQVHYLFVTHHQHEHCENHLHPTDSHPHCHVCKFDASVFTDKLVAIQAEKPEVEQAVYLHTYTPVQLTGIKVYIQLRGPPACA